jgi:hypothetical protein
MPLLRDDAGFDERQASYSYEMIAAIHSILAAVKDLSLEQVRQLTGDIAFALAAQLDGVTRMEYDGIVIRPVVTFAPDGAAEADEEPTLIYSSAGSALHEYVYGNLDDIAREAE